MFKRTTKILSLSLIITLCIALFAGCAASENMGGAHIDSYYPVEDSIESDFDGLLNNSVSADKGEILTPETSTGNNNNTQQTTQQKIIQTFDFSVETMEFDKAISDLEKTTYELGGYIEKSSSYGNQSKYYDNRYATYVLRIPVESSNQFTEYVATNLIVLEKQVGTKDVTSQYIDIQSRLTALRTEKTVLENLLANATSMSDLLSIQSQLTDVIYEIENYESKIRTYDNLISYTTVNIRIDEVVEPTIVKELTVWEKISEGFGENFDDVVNDFTNLFVWFLSSIPKLVIFVVFNGTIFLIVRAIVKKNKKKKKEKKAEEVVASENKPKHDPTKPFNS